MYLKKLFYDSLTSLLFQKNLLCWASVYVLRTVFIFGFYFRFLFYRFYFTVLILRNFITRILVLGQDQAVDVSRQLEAIGFLPTYIWVSNTERAYETAVIIARESQVGQNRYVCMYICTYVSVVYH